MMKKNQENQLADFRANAENIKKLISSNNPESLLQELKVHHIELEMQNHELRETQGKLQQALDDCARLYHQSPVGYATLNSAGEVIDINDSLLRMLDANSKNVLHKTFVEFIDEQYQPIFRQRYKSFFKSPVGKTIEVVLRTSDPAPRYAEIQGYHLSTGQSSRDPLLAINVIDKSAQRSIENSLFLAENIISVMPDGVVITDAAGNIINVNPAFTALTGFSSSEVVGQPASMLRAKRDGNINFQTILNTLERQEVWQGRLWNRRKNDSEFFAEISMTAVYKTGTDKEPLYYIHVIRDISRQTRLEQQLQQTQKMEALGTMVSGLTHNFNNLLAGIKGNLFLLQREQQIPDQSRKRLENIEEQCNRCSELLKQLLSFARKNQEEKTAVDLGELVNSAVNLNRSVIPDNISLDVSLPDKPLLVTGNRAQLLQALLNLLHNSVQALQQTNHPKISITLGRHSWKECGPTTKNGPIAILKIIDNGCGIEEQNLTKIFDPFFTTRKVGEGSGLGLSMVYGTIKDLGGEVSVNSQLDKGTVITLCMPLAVGVISAVDKDENRAIEQGKGEKILIVDDNPDVRNTLRDIFNALNYQVITAENGHQGMKLLIDDKQIRLLVTDAVMPETGGLELIQALRKLGNDIPIILITANPEIMGKDTKDLNYQLLRKPFDIVNLSHRIRILLDG